MAVYLQDDDATGPGLSDTIGQTQQLALEHERARELAQSNRVAQILESVKVAGDNVCNFERTALSLAATWARAGVSCADDSQSRAGLGVDAISSQLDSANMEDLWQLCTSPGVAAHAPVCRALLMRAAY